MILSLNGILAGKGVAPFVGLLDTYTGATGAYSLRKLRSTYNGNCVRVRRSSDNTSLDIGFVNNQLDTSSLLSFVGVGDGFISIWYDQSGSGNNAIQNTATKQPKIVSVGSVITQNSKPSLYFANNLIQANRVLSTSNFSIFTNISGGSGQVDAAFLCQHDGSPVLNRTVFIAPNNQASPYNKLLTFFNNGSSQLVISTNIVFDNALKLVHITSNGSGTTTQYVNSIQEGQLTGQSWTPLNTSFSIGALGDGTTPYTGYCNEIICYTTNQLTNRTGIESNINSYYSIYVSDSDAQAFISAANITDTTQQSAINQLVTDLKSANIWTKMKAIYPFVGGTATSHKFNLKDPRDLDAAYRLVFTGGWTHSNTGALPNGSNAYADTKLNTNTLSITNTHYSVYLRSLSRITTVLYPVDLGVFTADYSGRYGGSMYSSDGNSYFDLYNRSTVVNSLINTGITLYSRTSSSLAKVYNQNVLVNTNTNSVNSYNNPNDNIYIGAVKLGLVADSYSNREQAFATIGDGLSDTEATAFYNAVQTFNTTLGRQV